MKKETAAKKAAKGVAKALNSVLNTEANSASCVVLCQPKAPKELCRFKNIK